MKNIFLVISLHLIFIGCQDSSNTTKPEYVIDPEPIEKFITTNFRLYDLSGNDTTSFKSGESFYMSLKIYNDTDKDQRFVFTYTYCIFSIWEDTLYVANSIGNISYTPVMQYDTLRSADSLITTWKAPNALFQPVSLLPGNYFAKAWIVCFFDSVNVQKPDSILFTIYE